MEAAQAVRCKKCGYEWVPKRAKLSTLTCPNCQTKVKRPQAFGG